VTIAITARFEFTIPWMGDLLLQLEAAHLPEQRVLYANTDLSAHQHMARVPAQDMIGERMWLRAEGPFVVDYRARVAVDRLVPDLATLSALLPHDLPGEAVSYLLDSRYCQAGRLQTYVADEFGALQGGARVLAMRDWIAQHFIYEAGNSTAETTATDTLLLRRGVCRDFAHVMVSLSRASAIPARYVSCYAPGVEPQDLHALAEVFLSDPAVPGGGAWYLVDATGMADPAQTVKIGVGRDAADVSFISAFSPMDYGSHTVQVSVEA
jgi:transglutaminase-like putative cysteine protease